MEEESKEIELNLKPQLLYKPLHFLGYSLPDPANGEFNVYDRVVNVRAGIFVPIGLRGVIIGIHEETENGLRSGEKGTGHTSTVFDVLFDEEFPGGVALQGSTERGYKMHPANLLNLEVGRSTKLKRRQPNEHLFQSLQLQGNRNNDSMNKRYNVNNFVSNHHHQQQQNHLAGDNRIGGRQMEIQFDGRDRMIPFGNTRRKRIDIGELTSTHSSILRSKPNHVDRIGRNPSSVKQLQQSSQQVANGREHGSHPGQALFQQVKGQSPLEQRQKDTNSKAGMKLAIAGDKKGKSEPENNLIESRFTFTKKNASKKVGKVAIIPIPVLRDNVPIVQSQLQILPRQQQQQTLGQHQPLKQAPGHVKPNVNVSVNQFIPLQAGWKGQVQKRNQASAAKERNSSSSENEAPKQLQVLKKPPQEQSIPVVQGVVGRDQDPSESGQI